MSIQGILNWAILDKPIPFIFAFPLYSCVCAFSFIQLFKERLYNSIYLSVIVYLIYIFIQIIHGLFNAHNYWQYKSLMTSTFSLLLPQFVLLFSNPSSDIRILNTWKEILNPKWLIVFCSLLAIGSLHFTYGPAYFLFAIFIFWLPTKWKFILFVLLGVMILGDFGSRAQVVKGLITVVFALGIYFRKYIPVFFLHLSHWLFYFIALLFLFLGLSGIFNIFSPEKIETERKLEMNHVFDQNEVEAERSEDLAADTRTFAYVEVITSAIENEYVIFGRSPARGNDTESYKNIAESLGSEYVERGTNELCHLNVFTWTGVVGVVLYSFFYIQASFLALYRSRNIYIKYLAVLVSFHWAFGWVEDFNTFDMMNVGLWLIIGICISPRFRSMKDHEFELWFKSIFVDELLTPYHKYILKKELSECSDFTSLTNHQN